jgi:uncharacterized protein YlxW (UPF0749 family)
LKTPSRWARPRLPAPWRLAVVGVFVLAGGLFVTTSLDARGLDLRGSSVTDLDTVVRQERQRTDDLHRQVAGVNREVETLGKQVDDQQVTRTQQQVDALKGPAGLEPVHGPALTVTLSDAPEKDVDRALKDGETTADQLVVHQQDIQAVVNALWSGGAEAMTLQKQRVVSSTGIKCVGNTVVLHGVPYAPPYVITAVGDVNAMQGALDNSDYIAGYLTYVRKYKLGYSVTSDPDVRLPGYAGAEMLRYATPSS